MNMIPRVGVGVIIINDNEILVGKRKGYHGNGTWAPPGGNLGFGESVTECAIRETAEECGVNIKNVRFATFTEDLFIEAEKHYITFWMIGDYESGVPEVLEPDLCEKWEWYEWDKIPTPMFIPLQNLIQQGFALI